MTAISTTRNGSDPWEQPIASSSVRRTALAAPVPDDWDNDEDDDESQNENDEDNRRIWEDANTKSPNPMPSLIISPSATSTRTVLSPPPGAFQPTMRILKRPSNANSKATSALTSPDAESLKDREARYQAARERIFGENSGTSNSSSNTLLLQKGRQTFAYPRGPSGSPGETTNGRATPMGSQPPSA